jgi:23S rRNA pseudouridine1911/1915/1917 synthase
MEAHDLAGSRMNDLYPTLAAVVRERTGLAWSRARKLCEEGRVTVNGERWLDPALRVAPGMDIQVDRHGPKQKRGPLPEGAIVYFDRDLVVVDKPAGMLSVADEEGNLDTLVIHTRTMLRKVGGRDNDAPLAVVHRLDRETSGLVVFARTSSAHKHLAAQFREHDVDRVYHAIAHGEVPAMDMDTYLLLDRGDGIRGSHGLYKRTNAGPPPDARQAITRVRPLESLRGATLVECRLETGRQHQIRIHLYERGHPLLGEHVYIRGFRGREIEAPRVMLHARTLGFVHPNTGQKMRFEREAPEDFEAMLTWLRA